MIAYLMKQLLPYLLSYYVFLMSQMQTDSSSLPTLTPIISPDTMTTTNLYEANGIDYTGPYSDLCSVSDYCDIGNKCIRNNNCKYCDVGSGYSVSVLKIISSKRSPNCSKFLQVYQHGTVNYVNIDSTNLNPEILLYADNNLIKGITSSNLQYSFFSTSIVDNTTIFLKLPIFDVHAVANYDSICDILYYVDNFTLWMVKDASKGDGAATFSSVHTFSSGPIVAAYVDFSNRQQRLIYFVVSNLQIFKMDFFSKKVNNVINLDKPPLNVLIKFDAKNNKLYISSGQNLYYVDTKNLYGDYDFCRMSCNIISFDISDYIYYSCDASKRIMTMNTFTFCKSDILTEKIFSSPPLIVLNNDEPVINNKTEICSGVIPSKTDLPNWLPYAVGFGGGLLLLILIILIVYVCKKCKTTNKSVGAPTLPPGFTGLKYDDKLYDTYYTDLETFESTPNTKRKIDRAPTLPPIRSESVYFDLTPPIEDIQPNHGVDILHPNYESHENAALDLTETSNL